MRSATSERAGRSLDEVAARITSPELRQLAYEMAVVVCDADGAQVATERAFLERLRNALGLDAAAARTFSDEAEALATVPLDTVAIPPPLPPSAAGPGGPSGVRGAAADAATLDATIERHALLAGALELLPQTRRT
ncbi:MAG TPA: hypothetical protein VD838_14605 [Anaeromyxobacteraceae bacterium]|nr:hypothetical protein [Anaeromyxobacteraceae bacterium]